MSISCPAPRGAHPLAGKRAADLPLADGRRLYEALRGGRFLLAASPGALPAGAASGYGDRVDAAPLARASGTVALIRPDAYSPGQPQATRPPHRRSAALWRAGAEARPTRQRRQPASKQPPRTS